METLDPIEVEVVDDIAPQNPLTVTPSGVTQGYSSTQLVLDSPSRVAFDVRSNFLQSKSKATRSNYEGDLRAFFGPHATPQSVLEFLAWPPPQIALALEEHKARIMEAGLSDAAVNRRLAAVRSLLKYAWRHGLSQTDGRNLVDSLKVRAYRDTSGYSPEVIRKLLKLPAKLHGRTPDLAEKKRVLILRDTAMLRIFSGNGLRRCEIHRLDVADFSHTNRRLNILGKARGTQKESIRLPQATADAIAEYLLAAGHYEEPSAPLFQNVDHRPSKNGGRLTGEGIRKIVRGYGASIGVAMRPHGLRHSAITRLSQKTNGNLEAIQEFSRHADLNTVRRYVKSAQDIQGKMADLLSEDYDHSDDE